MRHELNRIPQFYVTAPQKCPYIKGKTERKLLLHYTEEILLI